MNDLEIEVRFLEIDKKALIEKLIALGAEDFGEQLVKEIIFDMEYNADGLGSYVRLRNKGDKNFVTYKAHASHSIEGAQEIEFEASDWEAAKKFLMRFCGNKYRMQEKKRHTLSIEAITIDIDTWPSIPTYVEFEGPSEDALKYFTKKLGYDWSKAVFENARYVLEKYYHIDLTHVKEFSFDKFPSQKNR